MNRFAAILCLILHAVSDSYAEDDFVALSGRDTNNGAQETPFRTIQKAVDIMAAGDTYAVIQ